MHCNILSANKNHMKSKKLFSKNTYYIRKRFVIFSIFKEKKLIHKEISMFQEKWLIYKFCFFYVFDVLITIINI